MRKRCILVVCIAILLVPSLSLADPPLCVQGVFANAFFNYFGIKIKLPPIEFKIPEAETSLSAPPYNVTSNPDVFYDMAAKFYRTSLEKEKGLARAHAVSEDAKKDPHVQADFAMALALDKVFAFDVDQSMVSGFIIF